MNRLTAIGLASLVAYGLLVASKYTGFTSAAHEQDGVRPAIGSASLSHRAEVIGVNPEPRPHPVSIPEPVPQVQLAKPTPMSLEFRHARDLKAFVDALNARRATLNADERYHLAKALEECQFTTSINEDLAAYSAKQRRQFLAGLPAGDPLNAKRISAYDAVDNTQRCLGFQNAKISPKEIEDLYRAAAQQGDPRAQARLLTAELNKTVNSSNKTETTSASVQLPGDDMSRLIGLLETKDPEAMLIVGQFLAQSAMASQLHVGPNGEVPEPSAFLGAFSLVACDLGTDCTALYREPQLACAYGGYCSSATFEELYQNFLASPWTYAQAYRYRGLIHTAIDTHNWALIGLVPPSSAPRQGS